MDPSKHDLSPPNPMRLALQQEADRFQECYLWLEQAMPPTFFEDISHENLMLIAHYLVVFNLQNYFSTINLKNAAIVLSLDGPDADLKILENYTLHGIKGYQAYVSTKPFPGCTIPLRIATIDFTEAVEKTSKSYPEDFKSTLWASLQKLDPALVERDYEKMLTKISSRFLLTLPLEQLTIALYLLHRAESRDNCQYEVRYLENWQEKGIPSMQLIIAWRNTPKHNFLFRLARIVHRHGLIMKRVHATYVDPYSRESILVMALSLHGSNGKAAWEVADMADFLREVATVKYFNTLDDIDEHLVNKGIISGNMGNLLRAMTDFIHQVLLNADPNLYTSENIKEAFFRHPELTAQMCELFCLKFDPAKTNHDLFLERRGQFLTDVTKLDTAQETNDRRRRNVFLQTMNFLTHTYKTNFFRTNYTALCFRLDPHYLDDVPFDRLTKFPELPFGVFFIFGMKFIAYHIRFQDLARGGLRTIYPDQMEQMLGEENNVFTECYHLAWTQHKKNKDIPEGGAKAVIFLKPYSRTDSEIQVLKRELEFLQEEPSEIEKKVDYYKEQRKQEFLYQSQRSFIESLITIVNCDPDGRIRAKNIVDYWKKPEYLYLGPDENMHDSMIDWIANYSKRYNYKPGRAFISSKPVYGINHKEYGVTSLGLNVYMEQVLEFLQIDPRKERFTLKFSGGPDGDVAGNQLLNLYRFYPETAKILALTDGTGTIHDDEGLDLTIIKELFLEGKGIRFYPPERLSSGGYLIDKSKKRYLNTYSLETLCWKKTKTELIQEWLTSNAVNTLLHSNVHQTKTDLFIPAGGRPRTLNENNIKEFLDEQGKPTSKAIIEGANLYLTPKARLILEELGTLIIKDSSANKGGVICSSFEVLCGLALGDDLFLEKKQVLVSEILERLKLCALKEAKLLLCTFKQTGEFPTLISNKISEKINSFSSELLNYLEKVSLSEKPNDPLIKHFLDYCLPTLRENYQSRLLKEIPEMHKKAIIACELASNLVYEKGLDWSPSLIDILPVLLH